MRKRTTQLRGLIVLFSLFAINAINAQDIDLGTELTDLDKKKAEALATLNPRQARIWKQHWETYAKRYIIHDDQFIHFQKYESKYPSSRHLTADDAYEALKSTWGSGLGRELRREMAAVESQAVAMPIPELKIGEYGYIHSAKIQKIYNEKIMRVSNIWLIDADAAKNRKKRDEDRLERVVGRGPARRAADALHHAQSQIGKRQRGELYRDGILLVGFDTLGNIDGQRYTGPNGSGVQIAIISAGKAPYIKAEDDDEIDEEELERRMRFRNRTWLIAIPVDSLEKGLSEAEFISLLNFCQIKLTDFADQVIQQLIKNRKNHEDAMFAYIESNRANVLAKNKAEAENARLEEEARRKAEQEAAEAEDGESEEHAESKIDIEGESQEEVENENLDDQPTATGI